MWLRDNIREEWGSLLHINYPTFEVSYFVAYFTNCNVFVAPDSTIGCWVIWNNGTVSEIIDRTK
jgi:hypothetical protein